MRLLVVGLWTIALSAWGAENLEKGRVIDRVVCRGNSEQSYALYLPPTYSPDRPSPILYCLDPGARGRVPVERFAKAAGKAGWIVVGSNNSRNGDMRVSHEAIQWMVSDTAERFTLDESRVYAAGFSGGARVALAWASNGRLAGVIAVGAGPGRTMPAQPVFRVFGVAGVDDFNNDEVLALCQELSRRGVPQHFAEFVGGHDWLPEDLTGPALEFLGSRAPAEPAPALTSSQKKTAQRVQLLSDLISQGDARARERIIDDLRRDEKLPDDSPRRRVARRVLGGAYVGAFENGRILLGDKRYEKAVGLWELAALIRPTNAEVLYNLAVAAAGNHEHRRALDALQRAVNAGFKDCARMAAEPAFEAVRKDARFARCLQ